MSGLEKYIEQLLEDIENSRQSIIECQPKELNIHDWISNKEEDLIAPSKDLEEWTGIKSDMLPPEHLLTEGQLEKLFTALKELLEEYNWSFVLITEVPLRIQYETLRQNFRQQAKAKQWHLGFFDTCGPVKEHYKCALSEFCHCAFFEEIFKNMDNKDLSREEERRRILDIEVQHIKRKYGRDWVKYYPFHLDPDFDDEYGNPYDYGFGEIDFDDEDDDDNWWRR